MSYITRLSQNVQSDANNSSVTNLAQNAFFIGTPTSTLGVAAIQVAFKADQNCTVFVEQSQGVITGVGTITTTNPGGTGTITGSASTKFTRDFKVGDQIFISGETTHYIASIVSDTVMTATATFSGVVGANYTFYPWDQTDQYAYNATTDNFGITVQAISAYERVRVTNIGSTTSLVFRLTTVLCPIVEALPRSLDINGNLKIASPVDNYGFTLENTPNGELRTVTPYRTAGKQFEFFGVGGTIDSQFWLSNIVSGATIAVANSNCTLTSGTNSAGSAVIASFRKSPYIQGCSMRYRSNIQLGDTGIAQNLRRWGASWGANYAFTVSAGTPAIGNVYTNNSQQFVCMYINGATMYGYGTGAPTTPAPNQTLTFVSGPGSGNLTVTAATATLYTTMGAYFKLLGTTFSVCTMKSGVETAVASGFFNGFIGSSYAITTNNTTYEIYWNNSTVYFVVGNQLLHKVSASTTPWTDSLQLGCFMENTNSGNTSSVTLSSRSMGISRLGLPDSAPKTYYFHGVQSGILLKSGPGRLVRVVVNGWVNGSTLSLYDAITAVNPIALITPTTTGGTHQEVPFSTDYEIDFYNGLYLATGNAATDVTIAYE